ncbi:helix-turn-helix transcriptional regulator [Chitinasiproducens palmae]|uniref:AraC-type DNA-binding protein n=1 Tax=Chitinasiproducens palmae TaxID=1770053 RepID=A0A1H2PVA1_9BURK|nr:AraC family transcriptional regulator [Chitinasiproducens palmae]SDV51177.1 AraC-type DNA-binding protein [Chitinasiproducens palmae]
MAQAVSTGLFRTALAGPFARMSEAFHQLRTRPDCVSAADFGLYGAVVPVPGDAEEGSWKMVSIRDDIFVVVSDCNYARSRCENVLPESFVEFHFAVAGPASVDFSDTGHMHVGSPALLVCQQGSDVRYQVTCGPGPWRSVSFYVTQRYINRMLRTMGDETAGLRDELAEVGGDQIFHRQMPLSVDALHVVDQLLSSRFQGARELFYVEGKCVELLCVSIEMWLAHRAADKPGETLSSRDLRLIEKARELIVADLQQTPTIPALARAVGTNASKLKRGFKFLFGMTIFEYGQRCRMNHALKLLVDERLPVGQVALAVGYQHQTSFTASFRDYFGFSPKDARRLASPIAGAAATVATSPAATTRTLP